MKTQKKIKSLELLMHLHESWRYKSNASRSGALKHFRSIPILAGQFAYVIDIPNGAIIASKGFDTFLGYHQPIDLPTLYSMYDEEDMDTMVQITTRAWQTLMATKLNPLEIHFLIDYRIRKANGESIRVLRQSTSLETDSNGKSIVTLSICTDITHIKYNGHITYKWLTPDGSTIDVDDLVKGNLVAFTLREIEVLKLLANGLTTESIARKLNISPHTASTHRKNMLRRTKVNTTTQLIVYALWNKII